MFGLALGLIEAKPLKDNIRRFSELQGLFPLEACEIHGEASLYESACQIGNREDLLLISRLRQNLKKLGLHLPFMDLNPISPSSQIRLSTKRIFHEWLQYASNIEADYTVLHLRGSHPQLAVENRQIKQELWLPFIEDLAEKASAYKFDLCLENADDMRDFDEITEMVGKCLHPVKLCLDIGHLYERIYPSSPALRRIMRLNDCYSPFPFAWGKNLPAKKSGSWPEIIKSPKTNLGSIHIHNHNGRFAHQPLSQGKIDLEPLKNLPETVKDIPIIIEVDYRFLNRDLIVKDLNYLEGLLNLEN